MKIEAWNMIRLSEKTVFCSNEIPVIFAANPLLLFKAML
jgi:hypothetical protein